MSRSRLRNAVIAVVAVVAVVALGACHAREERPALGPLVTASDEPSELPSLVARAIELTPAIRSPTSEDGRLQIVGFLELPPGARLELQDNELAVPAGTRASRVEAMGDENGARAGWRVLDVRETTFGADDAQRFRLLRPARRGGLTGISWPRSEEGAREAKRAITTLFDADLLAGPSGAAERREAATRLERLNDCASCHQASRIEDRSVGSLVQRGTDRQGLYLLKAVFSDEGPFERYRPHNLAFDDPFTHVRCGGHDVERRARVCPDGQRPSGWLDVRAALAAADPHAQRLCSSRRALAARMTDSSRITVAEALQECEIAR